MWSLLILPLALAAPAEEPLQPRGAVLLDERFTNLDAWRHEGIGTMSLAEPGVLQLQILGSRQGAEGCHAFCLTTFPDGIALEYDLKVLTRRGLVITFVALAGLRGEDMFDLPPRRGIFADYVGPDARLRSYHTSVSRYNDRGEHTGVSNWRRNPGLHLMAQGDDPCREIDQWYRIRIVKDAGHLQLQVDGTLATCFTDPEDLPDALPTAGKIGFRAIGADVTALVRNLRVQSLR